MSAQDVLELLVDGDGMIDTPKAIEALTTAIKRKLEEGAVIDGNAALQLFSLQLDYVTATLTQIVIGQQSDLVAAHRGLDQIITGQASRIPEYDVAAQTAALLGNFEVQNLARTYDALEAALEASEEPTPEDDDEQS
jgi:hypothetical protein